MSTLTKIGSSLKKTRKKQKLSQKEVAKRADVNTNYYARIERGEVNFSMKILEKLIKALKTTASKILPF